MRISNTKETKYKPISHVKNTPNTRNELVLDIAENSFDMLSKKPLTFEKTRNPTNRKDKLWA